MIRVEVPGSSFMLCLGPGPPSLLHLTRANAEKPYAGDTIIFPQAPEISHLPPVSTLLGWCTLNREYLCKFSKKFKTLYCNGILGGFGENDSLKNLVENLAHCPFKILMYCSIIITPYSKSSDKTPSEEELRINAFFGPIDYLTVTSNDNKFTLHNKSADKYNDRDGRKTIC
jgi:hypothetical protein